MAIPRNLANFAPKLDSSGNPTFTAPTVFSAGTVSLPSITFTGDTNTGIFSPTADTIAFSEGGAESMRIDSSGRLLVGATTARSDFFNTTTVAPRFQVELAASDNLNRFISVTSNNSDTGGAALLLAKSRGTTVGAVTIVQNDDQIGAISFQGADGVDMVEAARVYSHVDGTPGSNDMPGSLRFATTADGSSSSTERMRITQAGTVLIGTTSTTANGGVLQISNGITFPATQSASSDANTLDDYEEGTWTPVLTFGGSSTGITYDSSDRGYYTKIGNVVNVFVRMVLTSKGAQTGAASVTGLPFTSKAGTFVAGVALAGFNDLTFANQLVATIGDSSTSVQIDEVTEAGVRTNITNADFANNTRLSWSATYLV